MTAQLIGAIILWLIVAIIAIAIIVYLVNWLYRRSSKEVSFVRTGLMGERVVINGGAFVLPIIHDITPGQHERAADERGARQGRCAHHQGPHARRHRRRLLRARRADAGGRRAGRRHARPPHHGAGAPARAALRQVRLGAALGRLRDDHGRDARAARRLPAARQGRGCGSPGAERPGAGDGGADRPRPDRPAVLQPVEPVRRRRPDQADRRDRGPAQAAGTTSSRTR